MVLTVIVQMMTFGDSDYELDDDDDDDLFEDFVDGDVDEVLSCDPNLVVNPRRFVTALDIASEVLRASACDFFLLSWEGFPR